MHIDPRNLELSLAFPLLWFLFAQQSRAVAALCAQQCSAYPTSSDTFLWRWPLYFVARLFSALQFFYETHLALSLSLDPVVDRAQLTCRGV